MRQFILTVNKPTPLGLFALLYVGGGIVLGIFVWFLGFSTEDDPVILAGRISPTRFDQPPVYVGKLDMHKEGDNPRPFAVAIHEGRLLISFLGSDRIMEYTSNLKHSRSMQVRAGQEASLTSLAVEEDRLYAADFRSGELLTMEYPSGALLNAFGFLPDGKTRMKLFGIASVHGSIYATDTQTNRILAISTSAVPGIRDEGELLLHFPSASATKYQLSFPTFAAVTPDGRLLVSDAGHGEIKAFTCSGRPAHLFDTSGVATLSLPMGIAFDDLPSPELLARADSVFNPSGVLRQGRIHVVDARQSRIKVFNSLGKYVLTYGRELRHPAGIAIDQTRRLIFVADIELTSILLYKY